MSHRLGRTQQTRRVRVVAAVGGRQAGKAFEGVARPQISLRFDGDLQRVVSVALGLFRLTLLERDGLVTRTVYPTVPVTVEYRLTPLGQSLTDAVDAIRDWAYGHMSEIELARDAFDGRAADSPAAT